jgi:imidazolonepropionase-like amidohydrolase
MRGVVLACAIGVAAGCRSAPAPDPAPPERVLAFSVVSNGRHAGDAEIRIEPGGKRLAHFRYNDRGRGPDTQTALLVDDRGAPRWFRVTGNDYYKKPIDERLDAADGVLTWRSRVERGAAPIGSGWYVTLQESIDPLALLARGLRRADGHRLKLLPAGEAWIDDDTARDIEIAGVQRRLRRVAIAGLGFTPSPVWLDEDDEMFAGVDPWISVIRTGAEAAIPALLADDLAWANARAARLSARLSHRPPDAGLAIVHARLFDAERRRVVPDATVVVRGDRITAVGGAATPVPSGAQVIDARGRTLLPGLWDMHVHLQADEAGVLYLASGVTTVRDMGNQRDILDPRVERFEAGSELGPRVLRAGMIDAAGKYASPTGAVVERLDQALAEIGRYADAGYDQIKIYSSIPPAWVPAMTAAAHARGLRVGGHVPNGMNAAGAVEAGFDEIQHANYLFLQFLAGPGDDTRTLLRITRVAERAGELDLEAPEVQRFLDLLIAHKTVLDPTLVRFDAQFTTEPGELDPLYVPYANRLPAQVVRLSKGLGLGTDAAARDRYRASYRAMLKLIKRAWDRGIPIVAGTDVSAGLSLHHELELYVRAGIPAPEVLALATLGAARVMGRDRESGSIAIGKRADLVLVDGDPTSDIATIRNTDAVICRGVSYDPGELFDAVGMRGR